MKYSLGLIKIGRVREAKTHPQCSGFNPQNPFLGGHATLAIFCKPSWLEIAHPRPSSGHLHHASAFFNRQAAIPTRCSWQWLVFQGFGRSPAMAAICAFTRIGNFVPKVEKRKSGGKIRSSFLVVEPPLACRHFRHSKANLLGKWP